MEMEVSQSKHQKSAVALSIIPGFGQIYNRQYIKGIILFILSFSFIVVFKDLLNMGLWGIVTLGVEVPRDNSIFLLIEGILALIVVVFGLGLYAFNFYDAFHNGKKRDHGIQLTTLRQQYRNVVDKGFPYLILSPGMFLLIFVVIFPILFVVLLAFY